ncbi:MAG: PAS domain S-box protein [Methylococcaceae bacterium]|nr:MAG: PAS domain S-box protein [Methylococcaceae bacterium]
MRILWSCAYLRGHRTVRTAYLRLSYLVCFSWLNLPLPIITLRNAPVLKRIRLPVPGLLFTLAAVLFIVAVLVPLPNAFESLEDFLPLHTFAETFAVVVACLIFSVGWHAYSRERAGNVIIIACAFLGVALLDFAHTLSYKGMPDFVTPAGVQKGIFFWLAGRLQGTIALLVVSLRPWQPFDQPGSRYGLLAGSLTITALCYWLGLYHLDWLPPTFEEGRGLTAYKIYAEYLIVGLLGITAAALLPRIRETREFDAPMLMMAVCMTMLSELCFTLYAHVSDIFNVLGHVYKVLAYGMLYQAVFVQSVRQPYVRLGEYATEIKRTHAALEQQSERLRAAQTIAHLGSWEWDIAGGQEIWSDELYQTYGYAVGAIEPSHDLVLSLLHPEDSTRIRQALESALITGQLYEETYRILRADGAVRHLYALGEVRRSGGRPQKMFGTILDITERKLVEQALSESEQKLALHIAEQQRETACALPPAAIDQ